MALNLITDRTLEDVLEARRIRQKYTDGTPLTDSERQSFLAGLKGTYNTSDINRVNEAVRYVADVLRENGYKISVVDDVEWTNQGLFTQADWERYLDNVRAIREVLPLQDDTPKVPSTLFERNGYRRANDIEQILVDVERYVEQMIKAQFYSDEIYSGEV